MSVFLRLLILFSCFVAPLLASSLPNSIQKPSNGNGNNKGYNRIKTSSKPPRNRERYDSSVSDYQSERICGFNEMCKEEFSTKFRCRCPYWSFCSSPGRYYNAHCVMSGAGYLWTQPQGFFKNQASSPIQQIPLPQKTTRYRKKSHKTKPEKSLPHVLPSNNF